MKVNRKNLVNCLKKVFPVLVSNPIVPEYGFFHIQNDLIWSTDGEVIIISPLQEKTGIECSVPGISFLHLLESLKKDDIEIKQDAGQLHVMSGKKVKASFAVFEVGEMPQIHVTSKIVSVPEELSRFVEGAGFCRFVVSKDRTAGALCGVRVQEGKMFASDRYRILRYILSKSFSDISCTLPLKFVDILVKYKKEIKTVAHAEDVMFIAKLEDGTTISSSLLSGEYRDVEEFFPCSEVFQEVKFGKDIGEILDRHIEFLREIHSLDKEIEVNIQKDICVLVTEAGTLGDLKEEMSASCTDKEVKFTMNPLLLKDLVKICPTFKYFPEEEVILFEKDELSCVIKITPVDDKEKR
ncbi:MAG: hypothetical protein ACTSUP_03305 [Candidatus Heimdallarchaeaceae archaeon]